jgi:hypothetical protein
MIGTAETKWAEDLAEKIAAEIDGPAEPYFDREAQAVGVRLSDGSNLYQLLIPGPGALYALFRNDKWLGGMGLRSDAAPAQVARRLIERVIETR